MKYLIVPANQIAMERLDYDSCVDGDLREICLSEQEFKELWGLGILDTFNEKLNIMIDDFEDETIKGPANLSLARKLTLDSIMEHPNAYVLKKLLSQIELAEELQTGLFFYF